MSTSSFKWVEPILESAGANQLIEALIGWIPNVLGAVLVFALYYLIWQVLRRFVNAVMVRASVDATAQNFVRLVLRYLLLGIGVVSALGKVGVNTSSVLASLGVAGLTIGFAAKDALSNMISGIFIFWDRPFVLGDLVEINGYYGRVENITLRSTRVVTVDGRMLAVPNSKVIDSTIVSYTNFPHLRLEVDFTVGVLEDLNRVRDIALALCRDSGAYLQSPKPELVVTQLNDYNLGLQLRVWIRDETAHVAARFALREALFEALRAADVDMPLETIAIQQIKSLGSKA